MSWRDRLWVAAFAALPALMFFYIGQQLPLAWTQSIDLAGIVLGYVLMCLAAGAFLWGLTAWQRINRWLRRLPWQHRYAHVGLAAQELAARVDAIVIPISRREQPTRCRA